MVAILVTLRFPGYRGSVLGAERWLRISRSTQQAASAARDKADGQETDEE